MSNATRFSNIYMAVVVSAVAVAAIGMLSSIRLASQDAGAARPLVREDHNVTVAGVQERWRLEWQKTPTPVCMPGDTKNDWLTCPCIGFRFGESGRLDLVRDRPGVPGVAEDRLPLAPFFEDQEAPGREGDAVLSRWPVSSEEMMRPATTGLADRVRARPPVTAMMLEDYDHDGAATEFVLKLGTTPCGHVSSIVVGVSRDRRVLHAFTTFEHPERPLSLEPAAWASLLRSPKGEATSELACGDHGSDEESTVSVNADARGIHALRRTYRCIDDKRGPLKASDAL